MDKCHGIMGWLFGHKIEARYSTKEEPVMSTEALEMFKSAPFGSTKETVVENCLKREERYEMDICVRCGQIFARKERNVNTGRALEL